MDGRAKVLKGMLAVGCVVAGVMIGQSDAPAAYAAARPVEVHEAGRYRLMRTTLLDTDKAKLGELAEIKEGTDTNSL